MDIQARLGSVASHHFFWITPKRKPSSSSSSSSRSSPLKPFCNKRGSKEPQQNGDSGNGDKFSTDWDKAWSNIKKQKKNKKSFFSKFSPNKYVTWDPRPSDYPPSEEVDPIKRTERSNLMLWTSPRFTLAGAIVIVTFLLVYTIIVPSR
ncbi:hypothetical protein RchiOBHm_Chr3g0468451 [Rosa chinensis]|uniref:Uncharacterized protein n=1 Tax=Rosa chinensis TaxID=74649 RepID=A0A2P6RAI3_ROSCH|nr:uncharacterized protein LOC112193345 isoform X1 [Rosa chinensis]PRQ43435.1 hypothetical protein RchiOBHm_Chr3g0468451 [Rosa chinensis]